MYHKTIKDKLTSKGIKLINKDADTKIWQLAWGEINEDDTLKNIEATVKGHDTLKTWCTGAYDKSLSDKVNLDKTEKICSQPALTISEKLNKKKKEFTKDWATKLTAVKQENNLIAKLKTINNKLSKVEENKDNQDALKGWCEKQLNVELTVEGTEYKEVEKLCV
ncbi:hypothetical protein A6V39_03670 [Candidatus Mycoplasma haematobovis]|uniref:Uncharacterized protein n=1 Tax=Candidatus Mycoplasma haematobovis TaxID=432608 RepID=A0A1A9QDF7_9MOLU|nr:hypothetical protein [Candidatus Mycoplasma haematobovis]OAL09985.1 hypothetical protein A6V39_03670 [Candidatus Mycoplasma haematobovis]